MELLTRIDLALEKANMSRAQLARELGLSPQAISSLGRRENARLKHSNIVKAAEVLGCDLTWLATGQGQYRRAVVKAHGIMGWTPGEEPSKDEPYPWPGQAAAAADPFRTRTPEEAAALMALRRMKPETLDQAISMLWAMAAKDSKTEPPTG